MPAPEFIEMVHPDIAGSQMVTPEAFVLQWQPRGWELANSDDEQYLADPVPEAPVDVITRSELDAALAAQSATYAGKWEAGKTYDDGLILLGPDGRVVVTQYSGDTSSDYDDDIDQGLINPVTLTADAVGSAVATIGDTLFLPRTSPGGVLANRIAFTGDSITAANTDQAALSYADSWATHVVLASSGSLQMVGNFGHGGYTTTQLLALFDSEVLAANPGLVGIFAGTNDNLSSGLPTTTANNIKAMVAKTFAAGARPFLCTIPPMGTAALATPAAATLTQSATGGTLGAATYSYRVSAKNSVGETLASTAATIAVASGTTNSIRIVAPFVEGATSYVLYGRTGGSELKIATNANGGQTPIPSRVFVDTGSVTPAGALPGANTTAVAWDLTGQTKIATVNTWLRRYAARARIPLVDMHAVLTDPATGTYRTGYTFDGTHPTPTSQRRMGAEAWRVLAPLVTPSMPPLVQDNADPTNIATNGCLINGSATVPTGYGVYGGTGSNFVTTLAAKTGFAGKAYSVELTAPDTRYSDGPAFSTGFSVGDRLLVSYRVQIEGSEAGGMIATVTLRAAGANKDVTTLWLSAADVGPTTWACEFVVPASTTSLFFKSPYVSAGTGKASVGQLTIVNLTTGALLDSDLA